MTTNLAVSLNQTSCHVNQQPQKGCFSDNDIQSAYNIDKLLFSAVQNIDLDNMTDKDIKIVLPYLANLLLSPSFLKKQQLLHLIYSFRQTNDVVQLLLAKGFDSSEPLVKESSEFFESSTPRDRLRIVAAEYLRIQDAALQISFNPSSTSLKFIQSTLFDNSNYQDLISYCLYALLLKPVSNPMISLTDMAEALLHLKYGSIYIIRLVANLPDRCQEVSQSLINFGERQDEGANFNEISEQRMQTLRMLCIMNPTMATTVRSFTLQLCKMPSLTTVITFDRLQSALDEYKALKVSKNCDNDESSEQMNADESDDYKLVVRKLENIYDDAIAFVTGILLGVDESTSNWFAQYIKSAQQKRIDQSHYSVLSKFRSLILEFINILFPSILEENYSSNQSNGKQDDAQDSYESEFKRSNKDFIRATATLRLYCALRGIGSMKLNAEESETLLRLIICRPKVDSTIVNFATTGVCTLLACSATINNPKEEKRAAEWIKWIIKDSNYSDNRYSSYGKCSMSELLLLIAIHFQNNQTSQIADLVCSTLGMKLQIKASVSKCKSLFVQEVFNDQMVAEHAVKVPVTKNLTNNITEFLPIHCVHQLLESRSFSKHQVPIKNWIFKQICESKKPLHHMLPNLVEAYVNSVIISTSMHGHCGTNQPLSENEVKKVFETKLYSIDVGNSPRKKRVDTVKVERSDNFEMFDDDDSVDENLNLELEIVDFEAAQVLVLYYLLLYDDVRLKKSSELTAAEKAKLIKYSPDFMMEIPVFYLLQVVRENQDSFGHILPDLLKLVTSQYPQLCSIQHWLTDEHFEPYNSSCPGKSIFNLNTNSKISKELSLIQVNPKVDKIDRSILLKQLTDGYNKLGDCSHLLIKTIESIMTLPREEIWPFVDVFICNLSKVLQLHIDTGADNVKAIQATAKLWWKFNTIFPRKLWVMTINALRRIQDSRSSFDVQTVEYSWDELALDPLIVLRCDNKVFRCAEFLNIFLHILSSFLAASRRCFQDQINEHPNRQKDARSLEELRTTLILAQTSAAIQILLEFCLPSEEELELINKRDHNSELNQEEILVLERFETSVDNICEHLHQVFIADTNLAKLVHFQTYPSELLPTTCDKIPSMHICLDFIPELLSQPDLLKQVFVIELTSHLCEKYAITKSLNVAKLCFNVAYTLLQLLPSERRALFYIPVLPALIRTCKVFPILREDANIILSQINQITSAHMASTSSRLSLGAARPFEGLEKMDWREAKKLMGTFSIHEALYLCIQKCTLDLKSIQVAWQDIGNC